MSAAEKRREERRKVVLIYDSACPVCSRAIGWIRENGQEDAFEFIGCTSAAAKERFSFIPMAECTRAMQLMLPDGTVLSGEKALPEIFKRLKRYRTAGNIFRLPGSEGVSRNFYRWFADHRYHIAKLLFPRNRGRDDKVA